MCGQNTSSLPGQPWRVPSSANKLSSSENTPSGPASPTYHNVLTDNTLIQWDITDTPLIVFSNLHFLQQHSWKLCMVLQDMDQSITSVMGNRRNRMV